MHCSFSQNHIPTGTYTNVGQAYNTNQIIRGSSMQPMKTRGSSDLTGDIYLRRKEFVSNVLASGTGAASTAIQSTFNVQTFNINPGLAASFPWLSQVAKNFTFYEFEQLIWEYKPLSGEYGNLNTNALGKVVMSTQYDPDAPNFVSSIQMENYDWTTSQKPSEHGLHGVECKRVERTTNQLYVRTGPSAKDEVLTDLGDFQIATEGIPLTIPASSTSSTVPIGELWVMYTVKLSRANIYNSTAGGGQGVDVHLGGTVGAGLFGSNTVSLLNGNPLTAQYYNTPSTSVCQFAPKKTNVIGTWVGGRTTSEIMIIFPPGSTGSYFIYVGMNPYTEPTLAVAPGAMTVGALTDLQFAATNGYTPPSGTIGSLTPTAAAAIVIAAPIAAGVPTSFESHAANCVVPIQSENTAATSTWATCSVYLVQTQSSASQVPVLLISTTSATTATHNAETNVWIFSTQLSQSF